MFKLISSWQVYGIPPRLSVISPTMSTSSTYEDQPPELAQHRHGAVEKHSETFKRHLGPDIPVKDAPERVFTTREAVIQEIFETEENLLRLLHICMQQFILPLRVESSRSWITGVPRNVARLLDWFDDIVNLHEQIYQSLCSARDTQSPTTDRVSESLRCFVLKAEVYQPYLIRLPDVSEEISFLMKDSGESDFGQFVNLQEQTSECDGWSFQGLLMLPVHRLSAYQTLFSVGFSLLIFFLMKSFQAANVFFSLANVGANLEDAPRLSVYFLTFSFYGLGYQSHDRG